MHINSWKLRYYHPVSNLSFLSKALENVRANHLNSHINSSNTSNHYQSACRKFNSADTALIRIHDDILSSLDIDRVTELTLLDLSAAFDTIDHTILFGRLDDCFRITRKALDRFKSYLTGRCRRLKGHVKWCDTLRWNRFLVYCGTIIVIRPHTENATLAKKFVDLNSPPEIPIWQAKTGTSAHLTSRMESAWGCKHSHVCATLARGLVKALFVQVWSAFSIDSEIYWRFIVAMKTTETEKLRETINCLGMPQYRCSGRDVNAFVS